MTTFNSSSDEAFARLVDEGIISSLNPLIDLRPSQLNFSRECLATLDIQNRNGLDASVDTFQEEGTYQVGRDLQLLLPEQFQNTSLIDILGYWLALRRLDATEGVIGGAVDQCNSQQDSQIRLSDLDFTKNCPATSEFWRRFVYYKPKQDKPQPEDDDLVTVYRSALPAAWTGFANATIVKAVNQLKDSVLVNTEITDAANHCAPESCLALDYQGSNDIAGIGAVIAYTTICAAVLSVCGLCLYYYWTTKGDIHPTTPAKRAAIRSSLMFGDTVVFFTIMTSIASNIYTYLSNSLYEYTLSSMTAYMSFCAACLLSILDLYPRDLDFDFRTIARVMAVSLAFSVTTPVISQISEPRRWVVQWVDAPCYGTDIWPITFLYICAWGTVGAWIPFAIWGVTLGFWWSNARKKGAKDYDETTMPKWLINLACICHIIGLVVAFCVMMASLVSIYTVRNRAQKMFGPSYGDNSFGFGQIVASGFCLQIVVQYLHLRYWPKADDIGPHPGLASKWCSEQKADMKIVARHTFKSLSSKTPTDSERTSDPDRDMELDTVGGT